MREGAFGIRLTAWRPGKRLRALKAGHPNIIVEFKQGKDLERLKKEALQQILENKYYIGLTGEVICIGLAHHKKKCSLIYEIITPHND